MALNWQRIGREVVRSVVRAVRSQQTAPKTPQRSSEHPRTDRRDASPGQDGPDATVEVRAREFRDVRAEYAPNLDGDPDPGEVVWTWVPYVEHDGRGKDRPVLIVARLGAASVLGCYLTSKQHDGYVPVGAGDWDPSGRDSYLNPHRLLKITDGGMRREGSVLPRDRFDRVVHTLHRHYREVF